MRRACAAVFLTFLLLAAPARAMTEYPVWRFTDSVGVNVHLGYDGSPYVTEQDRLMQMMQAAGIRHIRDGLCAGCPQHVSSLRRFGQAGFELQLIMGQGIGKNRSNESIPSKVAVLRQDLLPHVRAVEGINEPDLQREPRWPEHVRNQSRVLFESIRSHRDMSQVQILPPALGHNQNLLRMPDLRPWTDGLNFHAYAGGRPPETISSYRWDRPVVLSETGYHNALNNDRPWWPDGHAPVSEQAAAVYLLRTYLEAFRRGIIRTYAYEMVDSRPDLWFAPKVDAQAHFGLLRRNLSPKPGYEALKKLMDVLADQPDSSQATRSPVRVRASSPRVRWLLLRKSDGTRYLVSWNTSSVWDPARRVSLRGTTDHVKVVLPVRGRVRILDLLPLRDRGLRGHHKHLSLKVGPEPRIVIF